MADLPRPHLLAYALVVLAVVLFALRGVAGGRDAGTASAGAPIHVERGGASGDAGDGSASGNSGRLVVHVAGAVRRPGVSRLAAGARVDDAVRRAGGVTRRAELTQLNLAAKLEDGRQVLVPERAVVAAGGAAPAGRTAAGGAAAPGAPPPPGHPNKTPAQQPRTPGRGGPGAGPE